MDMNLTKFWEMVKDSRAWRAAVHGVAKSQRGLSDWTASLQFTLLHFSGFSCIFRTVCLSPQSLLEYCLHPKRNLHPELPPSSFLARPQPGQSLIYFASMDLPILHVLYKPNHPVFCDCFFHLMFSRSTHVVGSVSTSFLLFAKNVPLIFNLSAPSLMQTWTACSFGYC